MNKKKEGLFKGASIAEIYSKFGVVLILILSLIIGTILSPEFLTGSNLMSVARNVGVYAIIALGMTRLLIGGGVDLSAGSNVAFCSVIVAVIYAQTGSTLMAIVAAILCGMIIGAINGYFASYIGLMPFIVTLATQMTVRGLAYLVAGGAPVYGVSSSIVFLGQGNIRGFPMLLIVVLVATAIMLFVMTRTSHGRYLYAIGGNPEAASASGINVKRQVFVNYIIMGLMCAFAGILYAGRTNSGLPAGGVNFEFEGHHRQRTRRHQHGRRHRQRGYVHRRYLCCRYYQQCYEPVQCQRILAAGCKGYRYSDRGTARYLHSQCDYEIHEKALNCLYTDFMIEP